MVNILCAGHHLSLAVSQSTEGILYLTKLKTNTKALFNNFHYSAVRANKLKDIHALMDELQVTNML